jgi:hypothetical protein
MERMGFVHKTVNHSKKFQDLETNVHTNIIEGMWNRIKIGIKIGNPPRNRNKDSISGYLIEFIYGEGRMKIIFWEFY